MNSTPAGEAGANLVMLILVAAFIYLYFQCVVLIAKILKKRRVEAEFNAILETRQFQGQRVFIVDRGELLKAVENDLKSASVVGQITPKPTLYKERDDREAFHLSDDMPSAS